MLIQIHGIGRSGTTILQDLIYNHFRKQHHSVQAVYEPFLWNFIINDDISRHVAANSFLTNAICIEGVNAHNQLPLFIDKTRHYQKHEFLKKLKKTSLSKDYTIIKFIRSGGRIKLLDKALPKSKIIFISRNPLDVVYSAFKRFSFYGGEVMPSDHGRFDEEIQNIKSPYLSNIEVVKDNDFFREVNYWLYNTIFAFMQLKNIPNACVIPYENLISDPESSISIINDFLDTKLELSDEFLGQKVGPSTSKREISAFVIEKIHAYLELYRDLLEDNNCPLAIDIDSIKDKYAISEDYKDAYRKDYGKNTFYFLERY